MSYEQTTGSMREFLAEWVKSYQDFDRRYLALAELLELAGYVIVDAPMNPVYGDDGEITSYWWAIVDVRTGQFLAEGVGQPEDFHAAWDAMDPRPSGASAAWPSAATLDVRSWLRPSAIAFRRASMFPRQRGTIIA